MTFSADITRWVNKTQLSAHVVLRKVGFDALSGVMKRSPVRTGRFRASNRVGLNGPDLTVEPPRTLVIGNAPFSGQLGAGGDLLKRVKYGDTIHITNNLHYARFLENGGSRQTNNAPDGIYGATAHELRSRLIQLIRAARTA